MVTVVLRSHGTKYWYVPSTVMHCMLNHKSYVVTDWSGSLIRLLFIDVAS
jgi:hypothetical protein